MEQEQVNTPLPPSRNEKIACECGGHYTQRNRKDHNLTKRHIYFEDNGVAKVSKTDDRYSVGDRRRYYPAVYDATRRYYAKKRIQSYNEKIEKLKELVEDDI